jgi:hypothetical protein
MQQPLSLSDAELDCLTRLAAPIDADLRQAFLTAVAGELRRCYQPEAIGPGVVYRTAKALQREFVSPPSTSQASYLQKCAKPARRPGGPG